MLKGKVCVIVVVFVLFSCGNKNDNCEKANKVSFDYYQKKRNGNNIIISKDERLNYHGTNVIIRDKYQTIYMLFDRTENKEVYIHQNFIIRKDTNERSFIIENHQNVKSLVLEHIDIVSCKNKKIKLFKYKLFTKGSGPSYIYWCNDFGLIAIESYRFVLLCRKSNYSNPEEINCLYNCVLKLIKGSTH